MVVQACLVIWGLSLCCKCLGYPLTLVWILFFTLNLTSMIKYCKFESRFSRDVNCLDCLNVKIISSCTVHNFVDGNDWQREAWNYYHQAKIPTTKPSDHDCECWTAHFRNTKSPKYVMIKFTTDGFEKHTSVIECIFSKVCGSHGVTCVGKVKDRNSLKSLTYKLKAP